MLGVAGIRFKDGKITTELLREKWELQGVKIKLDLFSLNDLLFSTMTKYFFIFFQFLNCCFP